MVQIIRAHRRKVLRLSASIARARIRFRDRVAFNTTEPQHERMRVALFGGSFDPPHVGHQLASLYVLETFPVDELWLVPVFRHAFDKRLTPYQHRLAMCDRLAQSLGTRARVSSVEEELGGPSYTLHMVRRLQHKHPDIEFSLVIGSDLIKERERWFGWHELSSRLPFLVLHRGGSDSSARPDPPACDIFHHEQLILPEVSSTAVRAALSQGNCPTGWISRSVLSYIEDHSLYLAKEEERS